MKSRERFWILLALELMAIGFVVLFVVTREPTYGGKTAAEWLELGFHTGLGSPDDRPQATAAVRAIGNKAVPTLLQMIQAKDTPLKLFWIKLVQKQNFIKIHYTPRYELQWRGVEGFRALGPLAKDAFPELLRLWRSGDTNIAWSAAVALAYVAPSEAVPILRRGLTNQSELIREISVNALGCADSNAVVVVPELLSLLGDPNHRLRASAIQALGQIKANASLVLPTLIKALDDRSVLRHTLQALAQFGSSAASAVPVILQGPAKPG